VFSGGSMLYGATGRTDLVGPEHTDGLTHAQYHSVRRLARELPGDTQVFPTHGFGSFCSATPTSGDASTVEEQARVNPALTLAEQDYVDTLLAGLDAFPAYYARMGPINRQGPEPVDLSTPTYVDSGELRRRIEAGEWVADLRERTAFAAGHLSGSLGFELSTNFVTYLGWLYRYGTPLTLIGESGEQIADARRELVRIGIDDLAGAAVGDISALSSGQPLRSYPVSDFAGLAEAIDRGPVQVLDARRNDERDAGHVRGSQHIPLHELADRIDEVPDGEVWVYCGSGYRASIAASVLDRPARTQAASRRRCPRPLGPAPGPPSEDCDSRELHDQQRDGLRHGVPAEDEAALERSYGATHGRHERPHDEQVGPDCPEECPLQEPHHDEPRHCREREGAQVVAGEAEGGEDDARHDAERALEAQLQPPVDEKRLPEDEAIAQEVRREVHVGFIGRNGQELR